MFFSSLLATYDNNCNIKSEINVPNKSLLLRVSNNGISSTIISTPIEVSSLHSDNISW